MNFIDFNDVSFSYPVEEGEDALPPVFDHFTGSIPGGFTSIIGPNGCGKSTFMLLASGRIQPANGKVYLLGQDVNRLAEEKKNLLASMIYQNMEFESEDKVEQLLSYVYQNGALKANAKGIKTADLFSEVVDTFELSSVMNHGLTQISKGENQRVLLAFALLYGSASVFMDEPLFAMEDKQKMSALEYLRAYSMETKTPMFISMHELDLTRMFAEKVLLIHPDRNMSYGTVEEVMTNDELEKAYGIPAAMLKHNETLTREELAEQVKLFGNR
ncbi:ABC transporter ATP-binding protein [Treponema sp.]|uniref:ABC transporter ATP-binding protein n=1 Tax=Treponema sp. TaxID=166 RepID=UPI00298DF63C|nr:ABC transporter ATP-binding protein [Treponema sp.]MCQ2240903.1 ABC transporter ATP-binding protein [Treponema sp.]